MYFLNKLKRIEINFTKICTLDEEVLTAVDNIGIESMHHRWGYYRPDVNENGQLFQQLVFVMKRTKKSFW